MKRNVVMMGAAAFVVVVLAWFLLFYRPLGDDVKKAQDSVAAEQAKTQDLQATLKRLTAQSKNAPQQQALLNKFDQAIPQKPNLAEFIIQLNKVAAASGIKLMSITPSPPSGSGASSTIALNLGISGSFFQVKNYLTEMEHLERLVIIDSVNISTATGGASPTASPGGVTTLSVTLTGRMFTRATAASPNGTATPTSGAASSTTTAPGGATGSTTAPSAPSTSGGT